MQNFNKAIHRMEEKFVFNRIDKNSDKSSNMLTSGFNLDDVSALCFSKAETAVGSADLTAKTSADIGTLEALGLAPRLSNN